MSKKPNLEHFQIPQGVEEQCELVMKEAKEIGLGTFTGQIESDEEVALIRDNVVSFLKAIIAIGKIVLESKGLAPEDDHSREAGSLRKAIRDIESFKNVQQQEFAMTGKYKQFRTNEKAPLSGHLVKPLTKKEKDLLK